jgi:hypothetical protein
MQSFGKPAKGKPFPLFSFALESPTCFINGSNYIQPDLEVRARNQCQNPPKTISFATLSLISQKKGEAYMNASQREHFRDILNGWKSQLMEEVDRTVSPYEG